MQIARHESTTDLPLFSVVIPCYNASATLTRAVFSCLAQHERSLEILLVDDASTDTTPTLMAQLEADTLGDIRVRSLYQASNAGPSRARNRGWDEARGQYIAFLDADDCWDADRLQRIRVALAEANGDVLLLGHPHRELGSSRHDTSLPARELSWQRILLHNFAQTSCVIVARGVSLRFDERMRYTEDHDLWLRISRLGRVLYLPGQALTYLGRPQLSQGGLSSQRWAMRLGEMRMYIKAATSDTRILILLPALLLFSLFKHMWSTLRLAAIRSGTA